MKRCELFVEFYLVINSKGWGIQNPYGLYLTDSTNFRIYLGHLSDHGKQEIFCKNDSIFIVIDNYYDIELPLNEAYSVSKLKELKNINNNNLEKE